MSLVTGRIVKLMIAAEVVAYKSVRAHAAVTKPQKG